MNIEKNFRVNFVLDNGVDKDTLISDFFDTAIEKIDWFRQKALSREQPFSNDKAYLKAISYSEKELVNGKSTAMVEDIENGVKFSFEIKNSRNDFSQVNEEGRRMWLRQHLDDHFIHYAIPSILEKSFNWEKDASEEVCKRFEKLNEAFGKALNGAYNLKTKTFWIDGE